MDSITVTTRSLNSELSHLSGELLALPYPHLQITNTTTHTDYLRLVHNTDSDWVVNIDEDAFTFAPDRIISLIQYMQHHGFDCCGMPDGGVVDIRWHNPIVPNTFFTIHNVRKARQLLKDKDLFSTPWDASMEEHAPSHLLKSNNICYDSFEPYYNYFFGLIKRGARFLYLDAKQWEEDGISTILNDHNGNPFLIHTWFARDFANQRQRILKAYQHCKTIGDVI